MPSIASNSDTEGFGIVFLEAAASGLPTIAGAVGGQPEAVLDGQTGFCVDGTKQTAVSEKLRLLTKDSALRKKLASAGRKHAEQFDWSLLVPRIKQAVAEHANSET